MEAVACRHNHRLVRRIRPGAVVVLLLSVAILATACGSSARQQTSAQPITKARAVAYAAVVNLREADVLGWERVDAGRELHITAKTAAEAQAAGLPDPRASS